MFYEANKLRIYNHENKISYKYLHTCSQVKMFTKHFMTPLLEHVYSVNIEI